MGYLTNTASGVKTTIIGPVNTSSSNRIVVTATEDLGGGLKATGMIENRLDTRNTARNSGRTGSGSTGWGRNSDLRGLSGEFGVAFGSTGPGPRGCWPSRSAAARSWTG